MTYRPTSEVTGQLMSWYIPRTRTPWRRRVELSTGSSVGSLYVMMNTWGDLQHLWWFKEHLNDPLPIHHHSNTTGHLTTKESFQIIGREDHGTARTIKESIYITFNNPTLNRNIDKFNLHHIWDRVPLITPGLKINRQIHSTPPIRHSQSPYLTPLHLFSQVSWSMPRPHLLLSMHIEPPRTHLRCLISVFLQTWWSQSVGWMKASLTSTNILFHRIYNLLNYRSQEICLSPQIDKHESQTHKKFRLVTIWKPVLQDIEYTWICQFVFMGMSVIKSRKN